MRSVERLNLALFVYAQHQSVFRSVHVQADPAPHTHQDLSHEPLGQETSGLSR